MRNTGIRTGPAVLALCLAAGIATAGLIIVPDHFPTIQQGLDAAYYGDTVLVRAGTYHENITWPNRNGITLLSEDGPEATVIDGGGNGRVINMAGTAIAEETELRGFTITGGRLDGGTNHGAGIRVYRGFPVITGNIIRGNENIALEGVTAWNYGGGIHIDNSNTAGRRPEISFNVIDSNRQKDGAWNHGTGIYVNGQGGALIYQNVVRGNVAEMEHNSSGRGHGAGIFISNVYGGDYNGSLVYGNLIVGNANRTDAWNYGGGVRVGGPGNELYNNTIAANSCIGGTWRYGGGVYVPSDGFADPQTTVLRNNIIVSNSAGQGGGVWRYDHERVVVDNSHNDVWNNAGGDYHNCAPGPGCISADPLFADGPQGGYYLSQTAAGQPATSPCVDAGTALPELPMRMDTLLFHWTTRTDEEPAVPPPDMGYHYVPGWLIGTKEGPATRERRTAGLELGPNPLVGGYATLRLSLPGAGPVTVSVYDVSGRMVLNREARTDTDGHGSVSLDLRELGAGIYLVRVEADGLAATRKLVVQQ